MTAATRLRSIMLVTATGDRIQIDTIRSGCGTHWATFVRLWSGGTTGKPYIQRWPDEDAALDGHYDVARHVRERMQSGEPLDGYIPGDNNPVTS